MIYVYRLVWVFFLFFFSNVVVSQQREIDSVLSKKIEFQILHNSKEADFKKAASYFLKQEWDSTLLYSLRQLSKKKNTETIVDYCHLFRGVSFYEKEIYKEVVYEFKKVSKNCDFLGFLFCYKGRLAISEYRFIEAVDWLKEAEKLTSKNDDLYGKREEIFHNLGLSYLHLKDYTRSEFYLLKCVRLIEEDSLDKTDLFPVYVYQTIATLYYELYQDKKAISYYTKAYELAKKTNSFTVKQNTALNMAIVEEQRGEHKKSLVYRKEHEQWKDSLNNQNKIWQIAKLEKEFTVRQKQKEVTLLQAENKVKEVERNFFLYSALVLLGAILLGAYYYREKIKTNRIITSQKEDLKELNQSKDRLFSVVSHDLRSSVNALKISNNELIEMLAEKNLKKLDVLLSKNSAIVNGAYNLLDNLLHWSLSEIKQSYFEMTELRFFMLVEQMAYNYKHIFLDKGIMFENNIPKSLKIKADQESIKIVLRNLLDNAVKFSHIDGTIKVYAENIGDDFCNIVIEDNGCGMTEEKRLALLQEKTVFSNGSGLGLQLCKNMISKNKGSFSIESKLEVGTRIIITLQKLT